MKTKRPIDAPNIRRFTRRWIACGCSHGSFINRTVEREFLRFKADYKPHLTMHLGDAWDTSAFMRKGRNEDGQDVDEDWTAGERFISELKPNVLFLGNHEWRLWHLTKSNNPIIAGLARKTVKDLEDFAKELHADLVPYSGVYDPKSYRLVGDAAFLHGYSFGLSACEDTARSLGRPCVFAHTHRIDSRSARVMGAPMGYTIGLMAEIAKLEYAGPRLATAAWRNGWAFGTYGDDYCHVEIHACRQPRVEIPRIA